MNNHPERIAWVVLLASFFLCVGLAIGVPWLGRYVILHATKPQDVMLEVQRAPLRVTIAGRGEPVAAGEHRDSIPERTVIATDDTAGRLIARVPEVDGPVLGEIQIYNDTEMALLTARCPFFSPSRLPNRIALEIWAGRVRVDIDDLPQRSTIAQIRTPHGTFKLEQGTYDVEVGEGNSEVVVREGYARIASHGLEYPVRAGQRVMLNEEEITELGPAPSNLIANGGFQAPLTEGWNTYSRDVEFDSQPAGDVKRVEVGGDQAAVIARQGMGHAETGLEQSLNIDVSDFAVLELYVRLRIEDQSLPVCGALGSECPVMLRINYNDASGVAREWLQGFYFRPDHNVPGNQPFCSTCSTRNEHIQVQQGMWYPYLSANLIPQLSQNGEGPTVIESIAVYASGHSYQSTIAEVELTGE